MATTSRIPAAQDALASQLAARAGLSGVAISTGYPNGGPNREQIWISGGVEEWDQEWELTGAGQQAKMESFTLIVNIYVEQSAAAWTTVRDRAFTLASEVESQLRSDPKLNSTVFHATLNGRFELSDAARDDGSRVAGISFPVACDAFLHS